MRLAAAASWRASTGTLETSRSRIKRLRGMARPQYRLRVEEVRVFYDVSGATVEVLAIVPKLEAESWLARYGNPK
jgi:mRNA-degrading endonuclease RelE of RelBE toxin-antitoxin system